MIAAAGNTYIVNTEGTCLFTSDRGVLLNITADMQADDGMKISSGINYVVDTANDLPSIDVIKNDIKKMVEKMTESSKSSILDEYTGPVLFDGYASAQMFREMISVGVAGQVDPVGTQRSMKLGPENLEKKVGKEILPDSFSVYDDPSIKSYKGEHLLGSYEYDEEGVLAERVDIVVDGVLENMVMSRVPTKKFSGSNGHARSSGGGGAQAAIGSMFVESKEGMSDEDLKASLIEEAKNQGLDYGLRVSSIRSPGISSSRSDIMSFFMSMQNSGPKGLGDPVFVYKVYVDDGREEMVRGCEFGQINIRDLRDIIAAGKKQTVYNYIGIGFLGTTPPSTIVAPPVLFEEMELAKVEAGE